MEILNETYVGNDEFHCVSHTVTHVGEHMELPILKPFFEDLKALLNSQGGANKGRVLWRMIFLVEWTDPGKTRWWAIFEVYLFLDKEFDKLVDFVERSADPIGVDDSARMDGARIARLRATIADLEKRAYLQLELRVVSIVC